MSFDDLVAGARCKPDNALIAIQRRHLCRHCASGSCMLLGGGEREESEEGRRGADGR